MSSFEIISKAPLVDRGFISLFDYSIRDGNGVVHSRDILEHCGAVAVVALVDGDYLLVRQYRPAVDSDVLEVVAGRRDVPGEAPLVTAARELEEEIGYLCSEFVPLGSFLISPGFSDEECFCYLGQSLTPAPFGRQPVGAEEAEMEAVTVGRDEVLGKILSGQIRDAKTVISLLLAEHYLNGNFEIDPVSL